MSSTDIEHGRRILSWIGRHFAAVVFNVGGLVFVESWSVAATGKALNLIEVGAFLLLAWFLVSLGLWWNRRRIKRAVHRIPDPGLIATLKARWVEFKHVWTVNHRWHDFCKANKFTSAFTKQVPRLIGLETTLEGDVEVFVTPSKAGVAAAGTSTPIERLITLRPALEDLVGCKVVMRRADNGVRVKYLWTDPLDRVLSIEQLPLDATTKRIPFAVWESDGAASLNPYKSTLVYGVQGSGKSSLAWVYISVLLARGIPTDLYVVDPKGGQEWGWLRRLTLAEDCPIKIKGFANDEEEAGPLLNQALAQVKERQARLGLFDLEDFSQNPSRQHTPTTEDPYVFVLIDELLHVRSHLKDTPTKPSPIGKIISIGRSAAASVLAVTQDATKETVGMARDLFGQRVCLRSASPESTNLVLFKDAETSGAAASKIPEDKPGLCYFYDAESGVLSQARIAHVTDAHIKNDIQYGRAPRGMGIERGLRTRTREDGIYKFWGHLNQLPPAWRQHYVQGMPEMYGPGGGIVCLYVGHGLEPIERLKDHAGRSGKPAKSWWAYVDHSLTMPPEWMASTEEALAYEAAEIKRLHPLGNEQHNKPNPWRGRLELAAKPEPKRLLSFRRPKIIEPAPVAASVDALSQKPAPVTYLSARPSAAAQYGVRRNVQPTLEEAS